jgi:hypothetical protein
MASLLLYIMLHAETTHVCQLVRQAGFAGILMTCLPAAALYSLNSGTRCTTNTYSWKFNDETFGVNGVLMHRCCATHQVALASAEGQAWASSAGFCSSKCYVSSSQT